MTVYFERAFLNIQVTFVKFPLLCHVQEKPAWDFSWEPWSPVLSFTLFILSGYRGWSAQIHFQAYLLIHPLIIFFPVFFDTDTHEFSSGLLETYCSSLEASKIEDY